MMPSFINKLANETSPYLLQHAHNPVNWYPWGEEALQKAKSENKVILVSIGYSACHWCHVMERESFEDESTAELMNASFINIKIDREERPDLDHIYMDAVQAITGSGGWPLNVFLTPEAKPFYGGTYFPPVKAFNRSSWKEVLLGISQAWIERREELVAQAEHLTKHLAASGNFAVAPQKTVIQDHPQQFSPEDCTRILEGIMKNADTEWGGFGQAPKFPQTFSIQYLLNHYFYTKNEIALNQALLSINKMTEGGIYDHVGGGFARYSTDREWLAPHFEKMLYDNALLLGALCDAYQVTKQEKYRRVIEKTVAGMLLDLCNAEGGFYAALDADSEGVEGKFYVWQKEEIEAALGERAPLFCAYYDVSEDGNWEGQNILRTLTAAEDFAVANNLPLAQFLQEMDDCLECLKRERDERIKPGLDDKIILGWNALMLKAIARAGVVLQRPDYTQKAVVNFHFLIKHFRANEHSLFPFYHTWKDGVAKYPAFLDDYAYFIDALLQLYEIDFDTTYLDLAKQCCEFVEEEFSDEAGIFFYYTLRQQSDIIVRKKEIYDGATPSANAIMAKNLFRLAILFDVAEWRLRAEKMLEAMSNAALSYPTSFGIWATLIQQQAHGLQEVTIVGDQFAGVARQLCSKYFYPDRLLMAAAIAQDGFPMLEGKQNSEAIGIYLCHNFSCKPAFTSLEGFVKAAKII